MDASGLRLFPLPAPDAVFPVPQDALLWTYWRSPGSVGEVFGGAALARSGEATGSQFVTLACSHGCAWLPVKRQGANLHEVLRFQHSPAPFASNGRTALFFGPCCFSKRGAYALHHRRQLSNFAVMPTRLFFNDVVAHGPAHPLRSDGSRFDA